MKKYIEMFKEGTKYVNVVAPVTSKELTNDVKSTMDYTQKDCIKFIPASGAATRMFKSLYQFLDDGKTTPFMTKFFNHLESFAFYEEIKVQIEEKQLDKETIKGRQAIVAMILEDELNYGNLPKALIKMHRYVEQTTTPIDEHIYEGQRYLGQPLRLHFTISEAHEDMFNAYCEQALINEDPIEITYSFQKPKTDTLAVDMHNQPFMLDDGKILYRAGGHGALIENLNDLDGDIIFIKNIDNVCHRSHLEATVAAKRQLATTGLAVKEKIDNYLNQLDTKDYDLNEIESFIKEVLHITPKQVLTAEMAKQFLNRPLRVCGVVKNEGEPGGGPFVVDNGDYLDLQICETAEIDLTQKKEILEGAQYFNPVDLVCFLKDYKGKPFNLLNYVNTERYFISEKTYKGRKLKALEHPGLWNGAMHYWNTLFVEVPLITFNPVKTVNDLLRNGHVAK